MHTESKRDKFVITPHIKENLVLKAWKVHDIVVYLLSLGESKKIIVY